MGESAWGTWAEFLAHMGEVENEGGRETFSWGAATEKRVRRSRFPLRQRCALAACFGGEMTLAVAGRF